MLVGLVVFISLICLVVLIALITLVRLIALVALITLVIYAAILIAFVTLVTLFALVSLMALVAFVVLIAFVALLSFVGFVTGLGLSMVHGLTAQLGGALAIESAPEAGTTVELWLTIAKLPAEEKAGPPVASRSSSGLALLVDDEDLVRSSISSMLEELGFSVIEHRSAEEALQELQRGVEPTIVLTDHLMPDMTGTQLASILAEERPSLPVLIIFGYADDEGIAPSLPRLTKPFRQSDLASKIAELQQA